MQFQSELNFDKLKDYKNLNYLRGCSGFFGFAKGSFNKTFVQDISSQMLDGIGDKWREWGSEQVMSNIVVANSAGSMVLPHPRYGNCYEVDEKATSFIHFIGICRFTNSVYARCAQEFINYVEGKAND